MCRLIVGLPPNGPGLEVSRALVVDDLAAMRERLAASGVETFGSAGLDFMDPWGNHIQIVEYAAIQFTKADHVLAGMGLPSLPRSEAALEELRTKGMTP